ARPGRVISVGSCAHLGANLDGGWILKRDNYNRRGAYANSKLANIVFAPELAGRVHSSLLTSNAVDPGVALSRFGLNNGLLAWTTHVVSHGLRGELLSARRAADTIVYLASSDDALQMTGHYFLKRRPVQPSALAVDPAIGRHLWDLSLELTGLPARAKTA